jgi:transcriptional regulator with XRE-family HTH domain
VTPQEIINWRKLLRLTQTEAATIMGVTLKGYQKWEYGKSPIDRRTIYSIRYLTAEHERDGLEFIWQEINA